jgi:hypothetical protein
MICQLFRLPTINLLQLQSLKSKPLYICQEQLWESIHAVQKSHNTTFKYKCSAYINYRGNPALWLVYVIVYSLSIGMEFHLLSTTSRAIKPKRLCLERQC